MGEIDAQRSPMRRQIFDVNWQEVMRRSQTAYGAQREIREVLVIYRVELVFGKQTLEMRHLDRYHAFWR